MLVCDVDFILQICVLWRRERLRDGDVAEKRRS